MLVDKDGNIGCDGLPAGACEVKDDVVVDVALRGFGGEHGGRLLLPNADLPEQVASDFGIARKVAVRRVDAVDTAVRNLVRPAPQRDGASAHPREAAVRDRRVARVLAQHEAVACRHIAEQYASMSIEAVAVKCAAFELNQSSAEIRRAG